MSSNRSNTIYTAADIEKYLSGKLSNPQMHEMEKAALDDPFLAEAMEGYEGMKGKNWNTTLAALRQQIAESNAEAKVIPMHRSTGRWWKTAAAVLVLGGGAVLTYILTKDKPGDKPVQELAKTVPVKDPPKTTVDTTSGNAVITDPITTSQIKEKTTVANAPGAKTKPAAREENNIVSAPGREDSDDLIKNDKPVSTAPEKSRSTVTPPPINNSNAANEIVKQNNIADVAKRQEQNVLEKKEPQPNYNFIAQVVTPDNSPLPFSNISIKSENFGTYADVKGNFRLVSTDTVLTIEVRSVGYVPKIYILRSDQAQNKIVLQEDNVAANEKGFVQERDMGNATRTRRATLLRDSIVNAEPADGWENYNTYIANNVDIPDEILKKGLHGEVGITFDINPDGAITNIRVDKSMGNDYDEAAKRLIQQGPQWKVKKGKNSSARIKVKF